MRYAGGDLQRIEIGIQPVVGRLPQSGFPAPSEFRYLATGSVGIGLGDMLEELVERDTAFAASILIEPPLVEFAALSQRR